VKVVLLIEHFFIAFSFFLSLSNFLFQVFFLPAWQELILPSFSLDIKANKLIRSYPFLIFRRSKILLPCPGCSPAPFPHSRGQAAGVDELCGPAAVQPARALLAGSPRQAGAYAEQSRPSSVALRPPHANPALRFQRGPFVEDGHGPGLPDGHGACHVASRRFQPALRNPRFR
jgi:hypothetical protein